MSRRDDVFYEPEEEISDIDYSSTNLIAHRITARSDITFLEYSTEFIAKLE